MPSTSIMATLTYSQCTPEFLSLMTSRGMQGVRINSTHVTGSQMADMCSAIRSTAPTAVILTDTKGAEVRTTDAPIPVEFLSMTYSAVVTFGKAIVLIKFYDLHLRTIIADPLHRIVCGTIIRNN